MQKHLQDSGHKLCGCGGYHYPHRPYSKFCELHPMSTLFRAIREDAPEEDLDDIQMECLLLPGLPLKVWPE